MRQPQHSQAPVAARTPLPALCSRPAPPWTVLQPPGPAVPRLGMPGHRHGDTEVQPGAPHLEQGGFPRVSQPCLPPQVGSDTWTFPPRKRLLLGTKPWVSCRGKYSFFLLSLFLKFSANTSLFHHWGNADSPALFFSPFTEFKPRKSSANVLFSTIFSLPKAHSLPQELLQLTGLQVSLQSGGM